jgi:hypothetical protein
MMTEPYLGIRLIFEQDIRALAMPSEPADAILALEDWIQSWSLLMYVNGYGISSILANGFTTVRSRECRRTPSSAGFRRRSFVALLDYHWPCFQFASFLVFKECIVSACVTLEKELAKDTFSADT